MVGMGSRLTGSRYRWSYLSIRNGDKLISPRQIASLTDPSLVDFSGRRLAEVARCLGIPPSELFFDILQKERLATSCIMHIGNEENVQTAMRHETHMAGSDGILHGKSTHPRVGTYFNSPYTSLQALGVWHIPSIPR